ncbi:MAG: branched-chain amino acid aminotransferase, partial [Actinomycetota bacterium]|nr:branched-chain amino acid aminotransferase [Actinomycetota bacterium]
MPLQVVPSASPVDAVRRAEILAEPGFGQHFTDHMLSITWTRGVGWHDALLGPFAPLQLHPSTAVLHYSQTIFEGLKAFNLDDGGLAVFRPDANAARFQRSAARLAMPSLPADAFVAAVEALVSIDRAWVPSGGDRSLYLRPFMFATEAFLGVRPAHEYLCLFIASPSAAYFPQGVKPVTVWLSEDFVRAAPGGTGAAKTGGNYAASLLAQEQAAAQGCDQVVWLDAVERSAVEEMGGMNLFFVIDHGRGAGSRQGVSIEGGTSEERSERGGDPSEIELATPELTGTLLAGITRESVITLAGEHGYGVSERRITVEEWRERAADGSLTEVFACGTAAVITPIGRARSTGGEFTMADGEPGPITTALREELLDIQHGTVD